jgi:hypothetical protein
MKAAGPAAELCALTRSALNPEIKIETARKAMVRDLCWVFIILVLSEWLRITMILKKKYHK